MDPFSDAIATLAHLNASQAKQEDPAWEDYQRRFLDWQNAMKLWQAGVTERRLDDQEKRAAQAAQSAEARAQNTQNLENLRERREARITRAGAWDQTQKFRDALIKREHQRLVDAQKGAEKAWGDHIKTSKTAQTQQASGHQRELAIMRLLSAYLNHYKTMPGSDLLKNVALQELFFKNTPGQSKILHGLHDPAGAMQVAQAGFMKQTPWLLKPDALKNLAAKAESDAAKKAAQNPSESSYGRAQREEFFRDFYHARGIDPHTYDAYRKQVEAGKLDNPYLTKLMQAAPTTDAPQKKAKPAPTPAPPPFQPQDVAGTIEGVDSGNIYSVPKANASDKVKAAVAKKVTKKTEEE